MSQKYSIGDVAKMLNMTTRAIRFYDQKDLVKPESIGENGYRYYGEEQIADLKRRQTKLRHLAKTIATRKIDADGLTDIAKIMKKETRLANLRRKMWLFGFSILLIEVVGIFSAYQFKQSDALSVMWLSIAIMLILVLGLTAFLTKYYYDQVEYVCPNCGTKFIPALITFIFSAHTPKFRRLACPKCHQKSYCLEIAR